MHRALAAALPDADPVKALEEFGFGEGHGTASLNDQCGMMNDGRDQDAQGLMTLTPQPSKSATLRVAIAAPLQRAMAAICASK